MAAIKFDFQLPDAKRVRIGFLDLADTVADLRPFLLDVIGVMERQIDSVFETEGERGSGKWAPLAPVSQIIRAENGFGGEPILKNTGMLRESLTVSGSRYALREVSDKSLVFGTRGLPYASHHQFGTKQRGVTKKQQAFLGHRYGVWMKLGHVITMPARPPLDLGGRGSGGKGGGVGVHNLAPRFKRELTKVARDHIVRARQAAGAALPRSWDKEIERAFDARIERGD